jgi:uncharacterized protein involved in exopolysaccharide biosynthesis
VTLTSPQPDAPIAANGAAPISYEHAGPGGATAPGPVGPLAAMLQRPLLVVAILVVCAGAGLALGLARSPIYTAESRLGVGNTDIESQSLPGYVAATQSLAGSYSRAIDSDTILARLSRTLGQPPALLAGRLSASPVAESSVIRVGSRSTSAADAVRLANAGSSALVAYVRGLGASSAESMKVLTNLRSTTLRLERLRDLRQALAKRYAAAPTERLQARMQTAAADASTAEAQVKALGVQYAADQQNMPKDAFISVLHTATGAASDRRSALQLRIFTGGVAGLLFAAALTTALANRRRRTDHDG